MHVVRWGGRCVAARYWEIAPYDWPKVPTRPFEPAVMYEIGVFHRRDREPSVLAAAFLELLESKLGSAR